MKQNGRRQNPAAVLFYMVLVPESRCRGCWWVLVERSGDRPQRGHREEILEGTPCLLRSLRLEKTAKAATTNRCKRVDTAAVAMLECVHYHSKNIE